ncbi:NhaP-type Na+/H+ or K+/H+ antiporter [Natronocella acetinitrilica]|uniref:NhaP-type Na+/H+ or K+/H+ antiporter n=1 Tax=Natronocella acetinitrilica TaxID=414046 RepID=A0AAE3KC76_9GAMM|nr:NhaP-type Na+/H+ or K+/H+ antiporter [Natronocella acetinitrilica]
MGLDLLSPARWGNPELIMEEAFRITLAIAVMGISLRLPRAFIRREWRTLAILLGVLMPLTALVSGAIAFGVLELSLLAALLFGATVTPTDPVVASSIVNGSAAKKNLSPNVRYLISAEAGSNDGLAYLLVMLPVLFMTRSGDSAVGVWLLDIFLWKILGAIVLGVIIGAVAGRLLHHAEDRHSIEKSSFLAYTLALTLLVLGGAMLIGVEEILAVFVAGVAFDQFVGAQERAAEKNVQEAVNSFFTLPAFTLFGLVIPWDEWLRLGWTGLLVVVAVLLFRRLPVLLLLYRLSPSLGWRDAWLIGWFGPLGIGALFYTTLVVGYIDEGALIWTLTSMVVFASVLVHGLTASPLARRYGRAVA